ncbi:MAG TPA: hypothetical protein PKD84_13515 [Propionicimonas sp.]|nr:hypothetical protein [Propionicimonas sp.]
MPPRKPGKPELTVVKPDDAPPKHPIESLEDAVLYGTQMDVLEQSLILSARIASDPSALAAPRVAALKSIPGLMAEIEAVKKTEAEAAHERAVPDDEAWDAEAY